MTKPLNVTYDDIEALGTISKGKKISYGDEPYNYGELRLPEGDGPFPLVIFIHGGCWQSRINLDHTAHAAAAITNEGFAVWTPEYRRIGDTGGGWPHTFTDISKALDYARILSDTHPIDLSGLCVMGHSAGGHLTLWAANRKNIAPNSQLYTENPIEISKAISLAGITNLTTYEDVQNTCSASLPDLVGGDRARYKNTNPATMGKTETKIWLVQGSKDIIVPTSQANEYKQIADTNGDECILEVEEGAGHFDMIHPQTKAWETIITCLKAE